MTILEAIRHEHRHLGGRLTLLKGEIHRWSHNEEPDYDLLHLLVQFFTKFPDEVHHKKEDRIYDALITQGVLETDYLIGLRSEHQQMSDLTEQFSENLDSLLAHHVSPKWSLIINVKKYVEIQELHMADEESQFLPLVEKELSAQRLAEIGDAIQKEYITDLMRESFIDLARVDSDIDDLVNKKK